ncbi:hypothetical protein BU25DRAFT_208569 [Macroventuria anomochaeta]|uniref:Uncharacterized protein n=1 Tax=Macroventuria anomochaeta TaxID=301207 RepID=A0ACB6RLI9_9PLEO|nr:uncharacterized protein BU25DRAFT_208569 [Macroventuria anomochaeta]KAF2622668.1 hypothetical protein BU25DRAFT_208569 [Macroventuria anomochaeta]
MFRLGANPSLNMLDTQNGPKFRFGYIAEDDFLAAQRDLEIKGSDMEAELEGDVSDYASDDTPDDATELIVKSRVKKLSKRRSGSTETARSRNTHAHI